MFRNNSSMLLIGIIIANIYLAFVPSIHRWDVLNTDTVGSREILIFSLTLSLTELLQYAADTHVKSWRSLVRILLLLSGSIANVLFIVSNSYFRSLVPAITIKLQFCIFISFLNIIFSGNSLFRRWIFYVLCLFLTLAISTSSWLFYDTSYIKLIFVFCILLYGLSACLAFYGICLWMQNMPHRLASLTVEQLHITVDLVSIHVICIVQVTIFLICGSNMEHRNIDDYVFYSVLFVSILMHLAWFCHNQINRIETNHAHVRYHENDVMTIDNLIHIIAEIIDYETYFCTSRIA